MIQALPSLLMTALLLAQGYIVPGRPRPAGGAAFSPDDLAGLVMWFETDVGVTSDVNGVSLWEDQSTAGIDLAEASTTKRPAIVSNHYDTGVDGFQGDGSDDRLAFASAVTITGDFSVYVIITTITTTARAFGANGSNRDRIENTNNTLRSSYAGSANILSVNSAWVDSTDSLIEWHRDDSDDITVFVNGIDKTAATPINDAGNWVRDIIMAEDVGSNHHTAIYGAIVGYDNDKTGTDRTDVRTYLTDKYLP